MTKYLTILSILIPSTLNAQDCWIRTETGIHPSGAMFAEWRQPSPADSTQTIEIRATMLGGRRLSPFGTGASCQDFFSCPEEVTFQFENGRLVYYMRYPDYVNVSASSAVSDFVSYHLSSTKGYSTGVWTDYSGWAKDWSVSIVTDEPSGLVTTPSHNRRRIQND